MFKQWQREHVPPSHRLKPRPTEASTSTPQSVIPRQHWSSSGPKYAVAVAPPSLAEPIHSELDALCNSSIRQLHGERYVRSLRRRRREWRASRAHSGQSRRSVSAGSVGLSSMSSFSSDGQDDFFESEEEREQEQERAQRAWWGQAQRQPVGSDPRVSAELNYAYALTHGAQTFSDSSFAHAARRHRLRNFLSLCKKDRPD